MGKKNIVKLLVILLILAATIVAYVEVKKYNKENDDSSKDEESVSYTVTNFDVDSVSQLTYTFNKQTYCLVKDKDSNWVNKDDDSMKIDSDKVNDLLSVINNVETSTRIENVEDMSQYGLDNPSNVVNITTKEGEVVLNIGDCNTQTGGDYYLRLGEESTVYTVESTVATRFNIPVSDLEAVSESTEPTVE